MINREREISSASLALSLSSIFWAGVVWGRFCHIEIYFRRWFNKRGINDSFKPYWNL